jgi:hypothetical protein
VSKANPLWEHRGASAGRYRAASFSTLALSLSLATTSAMAQAPTPLTPPAPQEPAAKPPAAKPPPRRPAPSQTAPSTPAPAATAPSTARGEPDLAYGAFQRGSYMTAFSIATRRASELEDVKAMTLLGELYANGLGVERDDKKAAEWYRLAADRGDREAMFALAMFNLGGRIGPANGQEGTKLLAAAAKCDRLGADEKTI